MVVVSFFYVGWVWEDWFALYVDYICKLQR